jgi:hypothetical protein
MLRVVDWSGHSGALRVKYLTERNGEDEWATLVKRSVCYGISHGIAPVPKHPTTSSLGRYQQTTRALLYARGAETEGVRLGWIG